ncbi:hypothetical protein DFH08DRAFT_1085990 [Mycena albidolilacea]|uniref:DUF6533 domain-containing protein n=1 Tax=Mycena albidolilacea TaxID=1033008 RepID=A0AAD7EGY6_9AGAR|nr:hypothetical protein DFH08DRAFT_1085990 [Mycena albidolilacea]
MGDIPNVIEDLTENFRTNCVGFAGFSMLIWDHIDTFATEVEYIWGGQKGPLVYLFLLNRYVTPLGFMVNLFAVRTPSTAPHSINPFCNFRCKHFIRYEGAMTVIGIHVVGLMMLIRIQALYSDKRYVPIGLGTLWLIMFSVQAWLLSKGQPVVHNPNSGVKACTMIFPPALSAIASSSAWLPLLYDSCVLILTLVKTIPATVKGRRVPNRNRRDGSNIMKRLFQDGLIYYSAIFAVNAVLTIMIISAPPGLKNIAAQLELLVTASLHDVKNYPQSEKTRLQEETHGHNPGRFGPSRCIRIGWPPEWWAESAHHYDDDPGHTHASQSASCGFFLVRGAGRL